MEPLHSIQQAAERSGLTPFVIRAWERRYGVVSPDRTGTNRRKYTEGEIERLTLLRKATQSGHRIGEIAKLSNDQLKELIRATDSAPAGVLDQRLSPDAEKSSAKTHALRAVREALSAIGDLDTTALETCLETTSLRLGVHGALIHLIAPLAREVGELWAEGELTTAHEHFASEIICRFLARQPRAFALDPNAPLMVAATPAGQLHEVGAAIVSALARDFGWRVLYLGANLPAADIAHAAIAQKARAVGLSIVFPGDDPALADELRQLRRLLPRKTSILAGGRAAAAYRKALDEIGAILFDDLDAFAGYLRRARLTPHTG